MWPHDRRLPPLGRQGEDESGLLALSDTSIPTPEQLVTTRIQTGAGAQPPPRGSPPFPLSTFSANMTSTHGRGEYARQQAGAWNL